MTDEVGRLRDDLLAGRWQRLDDPRLELMLLDDPGAWCRIVEVCAEQIALEAMSHPASPPPWEMLRSWGRVVLARFGDPEDEGRLDRRLARRPTLKDAIHYVLWTLDRAERPSPALQLARGAVAHCPQQDFNLAIEVLERWPLPEPLEPPDE